MPENKAKALEDGDYIGKTLGLDIRRFEDAMMFRIAMMVQDHLRSLA